MASEINHQSSQRIGNLFIRAVVLLISVSALFKLIAAGENYKFLETPNTVFPLTERHTLILASVVEILVICSLVTAGSVGRKLMIVAWLGSQFALYRVFLLLVGKTKYCACYGQLGNWLGLSNEFMDRFALVMVGFLIAGSLGLLASIKRDRNLEEPHEFLAKSKKGAVPDGIC